MAEAQGPAGERPERPGVALGLIDLLAGEIGPRRPCSAEERRAAQEVERLLDDAGAETRLEEFDAYPTFGAFHGPLLAASALTGSRRLGGLRHAVTTACLLAGAAEGRFNSLPGRLLALSRSQNLVAEIPAGAQERRTLCLLCHLDSSRSGLIFHPSVTPHLPRLAAMAGGALAAQAAAPLLERLPGGRAAIRLARAYLALAALLVLEREVRGEDVPGANDNASGVAVAATLALECLAEPLAHTRVVLLAVGAEEAGVLGTRAFLARHETRDWLFLNFDGVGAAASLHFLERESSGLERFPCDARLRALAERIAEERPELGLSGTSRSSGLPYDSTPVLARGGRALTLSVQNGSIPDYHRPTDTPDRIDADVLGRALGAGRELVRAIDRGEADG